jgi:hypothetical protein
VTEDEMKTKWCPMYRITALEWLQTATDNRGNTLEENAPANCIGSDCAMWVSEGRTESFAREKLGHCGLVR